MDTSQKKIGAREFVFEFSGAEIRRSFPELSVEQIEAALARIDATPEARNDPSLTVIERRILNWLFDYGRALKKRAGNKLS